MLEASTVVHAHAHLAVLYSQQAMPCTPQQHIVLQNVQYFFNRPHSVTLVACIVCFANEAHLKIDLDFK